MVITKKSTEELISDSYVKKNGSNGEKHNQHEPKWCAAKGPYPEVRVERLQPYYARLLMEDHAGLVSELSAITQYLYHHHLLESKYPDVADLLECIAVVEMTHMELLGTAIVKLGGKPKYSSPKFFFNKWWQGSFVYYGCKICDMLDMDIKSEYDAIAQYKKHIQKIDDSYIKQLLNRIIRDEEHHIKLLKEKKEKYCDDEMLMEPEIF
ncbi:MAG: ferritin-like domain-containing protein [Chitinophagales bacterium]